VVHQPVLGHDGVHRPARALQRARPPRCQRGPASPGARVQAAARACLPKRCTAGPDGGEGVTDLSSSAERRQNDAYIRASPHARRCGASCARANCARRRAGARRMDLPVQEAAGDGVEQAGGQRAAVAGRHEQRVGVQVLELEAAVAQHLRAARPCRARACTPWAAGLIVVAPKNTLTTQLS